MLEEILATTSPKKAPSVIDKNKRDNQLFGLSIIQNVEVTKFWQDSISILNVILKKYKKN